MVRPPFFARFPDDVTHNAGVLCASYRPVVERCVTPYRVSVQFRDKIGGQTPAPPRKNRAVRGKARHPQGRPPSALLAGWGLCLGLICAFADGFLTADQMGPVFAWLSYHLPFSVGVGLLSFLRTHWPLPHFHWKPSIWISIGLVTALLGKVALLPALRLARLAGPRATKTLSILACVAGMAGAATLVSGSGLNTAASARHALTSHQPILG